MGETDPSHQQPRTWLHLDSLETVLWEPSYDTNWTGVPFLHKASMMQAELLVIFRVSIWKNLFLESITFTFPNAFRLCVWKEQHFLPVAAQTK